MPVLESSVFVTMGLKKIIATFCTLFLLCWCVCGMFASTGLTENVNGVKCFVVIKADQQHKLLLTDMVMELMDDDQSERNFSHCSDPTTNTDFSKILKYNFPQNLYLLQDSYNFKNKPSTSEPSFLMNFRI